MGKERSKLRQNLPALATIGGVLALFVLAGCETRMTSSNSPAPQRDINAVLADHDQQLLAIPGVVGVYVGLLADQKTSCLKVMLTKKDRDLERSIPRSLEGYTVVTEVTGEIRPLGKP